MGEVFLLTTHPGLEETVIDEAGLLGMHAWKGRLKGHVQSSAEPSLLARLRSIHHLIRVHWEGVFDTTLHDLLERLAACDFPLREGTFRVSAERDGMHDFTSMDVQREAGRLLLEKHPAWQVNLSAYDLDVYIRIQDDYLLIGERLTRKSLGRRYEKAYWGRASLQPPVAYALVHHASRYAKRVRRVLDPVVGSGTLLFEAFSLWPWASLYGLDVSEHAIRGARENAEKYGIPLTLIHDRLEKADTHFPPGFFDVILADPPYGVRLTRTHAIRLGKSMAEKAWHLLQSRGVLGVITTRFAAYERFLTRRGFVKRIAFPVETGGLWPRIMIFQKP